MYGDERDDIWWDRDGWEDRDDWEIENEDEATF